jgi:predicted extracellular nuclease
VAPRRVLLAAVAASLVLAAPASAASPDIVISQVYGGGGNSGATLKNDFIELYNRGSAPVPVDGWSVQYSAATSTNWMGRTPLSGTIRPGRYYLVQEAAGPAARSISRRRTPSARSPWRQVSSALLFPLPEYDSVHVNAEFTPQQSDHDPQVARLKVS